MQSQPVAQPADHQRPPSDYYPPAPEAGLDVKELLAILRRRRAVIMTTALLVTVLAVLAGLQVTPKYTAKAMVMIDPRQAKVFNAEQVMGGLGTDASSVETQIKVIKSRDQIENVMRALRLYADAEFKDVDEAEDTALAMRAEGLLGRLTAWLPEGLVIASGLADEPTSEEGDELAAVIAEESALQRFDKALKVTQEGRSYVIGVSFTSEKPEKAARIANKVAELYVQAQLDAKLQTTQGASTHLADRLAELKEDLERDEQAVEKFRAQHNLVLVQGINVREQQLMNLNTELSGARAELAQQQAKIRLIRELRAGKANLESVPEVINSMTIVNLRTQENQLLRQESELRTYFGEKHPRIQNLQDEKAKLQRKVEDEIERIIKTLENNTSFMRSRVSEVQLQIKELEKGNTEDRGVEVELRQLDRQAAATRALYEAFLQRFMETREQEGIIEADSKVVSVAAPPKSPSTPGPMLFGAVGFTASLMLGTLLALLLERLDSGLRSGKQVEQALGVPALGLVPRIDRLRKGQKPHQYLLEKPLSAYAEAIRSIYTSLQLSDVDNPPKVVLVTSALPQEGKTTLSVSLASFAAQSGQKVLLMDLDLRHPSIQRELGFKARTGFIEYMAGEKELEEVIGHDEGSRLDYIPINRQTANPTDFLGSQRMKQLIARLRDTYDYVVIDSAPLLGVTDTRVASLLADKVVFVVHWEKTTKDTAANGLAHLRDVRANIGGGVLTQVDVGKHALYGYGDVGQYYGKYHKYYIN